MVVVVACASSRAQFPIQQYTTRELLPLGELLLSNTELQFAALGQMKLQYVGIMPDSAGPDIAGATIYRVKNARSFSLRKSSEEGHLLLKRYPFGLP